MTIRNLIKSALCVVVAVISITATASDVPALMRLDLKNGKIIAEIPQSLLGQRLMMATRIEQTSDSGEGLAGQLSDNCIPLVFDLQGKELDVIIPMDHSLLEEASIPGVWKRYTVTSVKPDSTIVVDLTDLFETQYSQLYTFPAKAYNSMGGQVRRVHTLQKDRSKFVSTDVRDSVASVLCDFYYKMDGYIMGVMKVAGDYSVRAQVRKMIFLPCTEPDFTTLDAHPAVAVNTLQLRSIDAPTQAVSTTDIVRRWNITPSDKIVFYVDTLMPKNWRPYVEEGILAWNKAFEQAGFNEVLRAKDFPSDPSFFSASPYLSRVIYAPSGMEQVEVGDLYDTATGEIFSAQICLHSNFIKKQHLELLKSCAAINPDVRCENLPDSIAGQLVRQSVMSAVGKALGLRDLPGKNRIAIEGVDLQATAPSEYHQKAITWLYGSESHRDEKSIFELVKLQNPSPLTYFEDLDKWIENQKVLFENLFEYFPGASTEFLVSLVTGVQDQFARNVVKLFQFVGGAQTDVYGYAVPYSAEVQRRAVKAVISHLKDVDWFKSVPAGRLPYSTNEFIGDVYRTNIFTNLVARFKRLEAEYTQATFLKDISAEIFGSYKTAKTKLIPIEMVWQTSFVEFLLGQVEENAACYNAAHALRQQVYNASLSARGEVADHYAYLLFVMDKKLNE